MVRPIPRPYIRTIMEDNGILEQVGGQYVAQLEGAGVRHYQVWRMQRDTGRMTLVDQVR